MDTESGQNCTQGIHTLQLFLRIILTEIGIKSTFHIKSGAIKFNI